MALVRCLLWVVALCAACTCHAATEQARQLPSDSVYQLDVVLTNQNGREFALADLRDQPVLIAMFYTSCKYVCPLIVDAMLRIDRVLVAEDKSKVHLVLVSFDSERDSPQALKELAARRHLDAARWTLARADAVTVRKLAAVLGVQYRATTNGEFNHSSVITLLDRQGRIAARSVRMGEEDPEFLRLLRVETARSD